MSKLSRATLVLLATAVGLSATTLTINLPTVNYSSLTQQGNIVLPEFNSSLGTLTDVSITFGPGTDSGNNSVTDVENNTSINITALVGYGAIFQVPTGAQYNPTAASLITCTASNAEIATCNNTGTFLASNLSDSIDLAADIPGFLTSNQNVPYISQLIETVEGSTTPTNPTGLSFGVTNQDLVMPVSITYTYTATGSTPEPGTFLLLGAGLIGAACFARVRSKRVRAIAVRADSY